MSRRARRVRSKVAVRSAAGVEDPAAACLQAQGDLASLRRCCDWPFRHSRAPFGGLNAGLDRTQLALSFATIEPSFPAVQLCRVAAQNSVWFACSVQLCVKRIAWLTGLGRRQRILISSRKESARCSW